MKMLDDKQIKEEANAALWGNRLQNPVFKVPVSFPTECFFGNSNAHKAIRKELVNNQRLRPHV